MFVNLKKIKQYWRQLNQYDIKSNNIGTVLEVIELAEVVEEAAAAVVGVIVVAMGAEASINRWF